MATMEILDEDSKIKLIKESKEEFENRQQYYNDLHREMKEKLRSDNSA